MTLLSPMQVAAASHAASSPETPMGFSITNQRELSPEKSAMIHQQLQHYREMNKNCLHAFAVATNGVQDLNKIYFTIEEAFARAMGELKASGHIPNTTADITENFMTYGFPRYIANVQAVESVLIFIERTSKPTLVWQVRMVFQFKADSVLIFTTQVVM